MAYDIIGDIHGHADKLEALLRTLGYRERAGTWSHPGRMAVFVGDYIDRGGWSLETILFLMAIKLRYPENFFLLRGNHETGLVNRIYGFYEDLSRRCTPRLNNVFLVRIPPYLIRTPNRTRST